MTEQGTKHDNGKIRFDLVPWEIIEELANVYTVGAKEYGVNNWRAGFEYGRLIGAMFRHFTSWIAGHDYDDKSGLHHLDSAIWNLVTLRYQVKHGTGIDDRWCNNSDNDDSRN